MEKLAFSSTLLYPASLEPHALAPTARSAILHPKSWAVVEESLHLLVLVRLVLRALNLASTDTLALVTAAHFSTLQYALPLLDKLVSPFIRMRACTAMPVLAQDARLLTERLVVLELLVLLPDVRLCTHLLLKYLARFAHFYYYV